MTAPPDSENRPVYSSRIINAYIKLIRRNYRHVNIGELLRHAGMESYQIADQDHWFTLKQLTRFHEKLVSVTGDIHIAREAGRFAASPDAIGVMRQQLPAMMDPADAVSHIGKAAVNFTSSTLFQSRKLSPNTVEITTLPADGGDERPFQCEYRIGFLEGVGLGLTNQMPRIEHPECAGERGKSCRYIVSWEKSASLRHKSLRTLTALICLPAFLAFFAVNPIISLVVIMPLGICLFLLFSWLIERAEKEDLHNSLNFLRGSTDELIAQININYNNALMANEIGQAIGKEAKIQDILNSVFQISEKRLDYDRGMVLLANPEKTRLAFRAGFGFDEETLRFLRRMSFHTDKPGAKGIFVRAFQEQKPVVMNNLNQILGDLSLTSQTFAKRMGSQSFICCPIVCDGESIGVIAVDYTDTKKPMVQSDISLLMGIAPVIGISIRNADLLDGRVRQFRSIIRTLAVSIDARDPLTAGHSEKVTEYTLGICRELGLSKDQCEVVRVASLLHDYGKIAVPDAILKKQGKLTDSEYEIVKTHSEKTREILEKISFEGIFSQVPEIAGSHHEKMDGSGYPNGLKKNEIPLGARIIAVADFIEAITSKRHYRDPMPRAEAFQLLKQESGVHFDKKVVDAFFNYYNTYHTTTRLPLASSM